MKTKKHVKLPPKLTYDTNKNDGLEDDISFQTWLMILGIYCEISGRVRPFKKAHECLQLFQTSPLPIALSNKLSDRPSMAMFGSDFGGLNVWSFSTVGPGRLGGWANKVEHWLVVEPTPLKNISQIGNLPQIGVKIKNI